MFAPSHSKSTGLTLASRAGLGTEGYFIVGPSFYLNSPKSPAGSGRAAVIRIGVRR